LLADFQKVSPAAGQSSPPAKSQPGILARVYEKQTVLWDEHGFFRADKPMLPDLDKETPVTTTVVPGFVLPWVNPSHPVIEQAKGFYRFSGWYHAAEPGVYTFSVDSCGPVRLQVGGQNAVASTGVFHQQQAVRRGEAVLGTGWHAVDLIVCDPILWNINTHGEMPFSVTVSQNGSEAAAIPSADLRAVTGGAGLTPSPEIVWKASETPPAWMEPGVVMATYERQGKRREPDYLDIDTLNPIRVEAADDLEPNIRPDLVRVYNGWFHAPADGIYTFDLAARRSGREHLSDLSAACQNQLRIGDEILVQRGVHGRRPLGKIGLKSGWHPISIRFGSSLADGTVTYPDGQTLALSAAELRRASVVEIAPVDQSAGQSLHEIYGPTSVSIRLPAQRVGVIRYTLDGTSPTAESPKFQDPISVDRSTTVKAAAFLPDGTAVGANAVEFHLVRVPEAGLIASASFDKWSGETGVLSLDDRSTAWIAGGSQKVDLGGHATLAVHRQGKLLGSKAAVDINVARPTGTAGLKLSGLKMRDNAITVGIWFKSDTADGQLFGKDGLTAFGKRYRTASSSLVKGRVVGVPGGLSGGEVRAGEWTHVTLTANAKESRLYLNGSEVSRGQGSASLLTDALDFFSSHPAEIFEVRIYDRVLGPEDIRRLHDATVDQLPNTK
jgi:hypothetical protein